MSEGLYSLKMRASAAGLHVSGAERLVTADRAPDVARALVARALTHAKGTPDFINVKVEAVAEPLVLEALPVSTHTAATPEEGWAIVRRLLAQDGVARLDEILALFRETYTMRGAMLLDADTLERLEPDPARGVRATYMDAALSQTSAVSCVKNHYAEAIVLATKVAHAPGIVGEICMSDDPDYVTGYVASRRLGYARITCLKKKGDGAGGRIFLYRGPREKIAETISFLESRAVLVQHVPPHPSQMLVASVSSLDSYRDELNALRAAGLGRAIRPRPKELLIFSDNDYLGLAADPRLKEAARKALEEEGAGSGGARLLAGTHPAHLALEAHLARFKGTEDALTWATGYMTNVGTISALVGRGDAIFSDELNHASIVDGCRLSRADIFVYRHNDMADLARQIAAAGPRRRRLAVSDAVFSMDGDVLDLPHFLEVCRANGVVSMIDEAHSTGVMGRTGRGLCEHFGCDHPDLLMGTLSKALGSEGGYVAASRLFCDYLRNRSRAFIFSTAWSPSSAAAADCALSILERETDLAARVRAKTAHFLAELSKQGIQAQTESAIVPILIGDEKKALALAEKLEAKGFFVPAIRYPTVARGAARLRVSLSSTMRDEDLTALAAAIGELSR